MGQSIATLLVGTAALYLGNGLLVTLLPIRAQFEGFSTTVIGLMGGAFFTGFAVACVIGPRIVKQVGHIRCFAGFAALAAAGSLAFPLMVDSIAWCALRGFTGLCFAMLYMVVESWLNERSSNENRGQVLSIYIIITNIVTMGGQLMVNLYDPGGPLLFSLVAILVCLSLVPLSLTQTAQPAPVPVARVRIVRLFGLSPTGVAGCLVIGLIEGAFWTLGPIFAQGQGLEVAQVTFFMSAFVLGGTLSQWPLGRLSDRIDRRKVIVGCCLGTVCTGLAMAFADLGDGAATFVVATLHGGFMVPLYALCLAHANDHAPREALVETSSALLLVYAVGAILGPLAVAPLMDGYGLGSLFLFMAVVLGALALFALIRMALRPVVAAEDRVEFVPVPKTTPSVYSLEADD